MVKIDESTIPHGDDKDKNATAIPRTHVRDATDEADATAKTIGNDKSSEGGGADVSDPMILCSSV